MSKKVWNLETYCKDEDIDMNPVGEKRWYRLKDWGCEVEDNFENDAFTDKEPLGLEQSVIPKQHFDEAENEWVLDEAIDQGVIDAMVKIPKLEIRRAMRKLGIEDALDTLLASSNELYNDWNDSVEIDLGDGAVVGALEQMDIDVDVVKRKILELK